MHFAFPSSETSSNISAQFPKNTSPAKIVSSCKSESDFVNANGKEMAKNWTYFTGYVFGAANAGVWVKIQAIFTLILAQAIRNIASPEILAEKSGTLDVGQT